MRPKKLIDYKVIIMRGVSGVGKTSLARSIAEKCLQEGNTHIVSANDYFVDEDGIYRWNPVKLPEAHAACYRKFLDDMIFFEQNPEDWSGRRTIVDNTNLRKWEIAPYILAAQACKVPYVIAEVSSPESAEVLEKRNAHGVSARSIQGQILKMFTSDDFFPREWEHLFVRSGSFRSGKGCFCVTGTDEIFSMPEEEY